MAVGRLARELDEGHGGRLGGRDRLRILVAGEGCGAVGEIPGGNVGDETGVDVVLGDDIASRALDRCAGRHRSGRAGHGDLVVGDAKRAGHRHVAVVGQRVRVADRLADGAVGGRAGALGQHQRAALLGRHVDGRLVRVDGVAVEAGVALGHVGDGAAGVDVFLSRRIAGVADDRGAQRRQFRARVSAGDRAKGGIGHGERAGQRDVAGVGVRQRVGVGDRLVRGVIAVRVRGLRDM